LRLEETLPKERRIPFHAKNILAGFREVFTTRSTVCYTICMGFCFGGLMAYLNSSQQIFQDQFGAGKMFGAYFGGLAAMIAVSSMLNARLVEKHGMRTLCLRSFAAIVMVSFLFLLLHALVDINLMMFLGYAAVLFFCFGLIFGNLNALAMEPMGHIAGIAAAITGCVSSMMSMSIGIVIGQMYNGTLLPMVAGFIILGMLAMLFIKLAEKKAA
jgi:DHA1 family bicyclomycin/chloramphenicol resistance-like MFS transporter